ncbi:MAG TPA: hypothetical protein VD790_01150 [Thermoleophilaceae bacterium]|nr:hypothetical protein [Thermoleophilaceae bacterium]
MFAVALTPVAPPPAQAKQSFFGVQGWVPPSPKQFKRLSRQGVGMVRMTLGWGQHEPRRGKRTWGYGDDMVARAALARVKLLPVLVGTPWFASKNPLHPPTTRKGRRGYARYVEDVVRRYGRRGRFWKRNPHLPYKPITSWQVWNEPNFPAWWLNRPNAKQYVSFLRLAAKRIRKADPKARVVLAGLPETKTGIPATKFLRQIYRVRGAKKHFDVVALNTYAHDHRGVFGALKRARRTMRKHGDRRAKIMISEIGWATGGDESRRTHPFRTTLKGQARRLRVTFRKLKKHRERYRITNVIWFSLRDRAAREDEPNWWGLHTGLFFADGRPKPAWRAYTSFTKAK